VYRKLGGIKRTRQEQGIIFFLWKRKRKSSIGNRIFVRHRIGSAVKRAEFVSDRMSYIVLRGSWHNIIVSNVHSSSEENSDDSKDSFYEELEQVFEFFLSTT